MGKGGQVEFIDLPVVWSYCWVKYLHFDNYLPFMKVDGTYQYSTTTFCPLSYRVKVFTLNEPLKQIEWQAYTYRPKPNYGSAHDIISKEPYWPLKEPEHPEYNRFQYHCVVVHCENPTKLNVCNGIPILTFSFKINWCRTWNPASCCKDRMEELCHSVERKGPYCSPTWASEYTNERWMVESPNPDFDKYPKWLNNLDFPKLVNFTFDARLVFEIYRAEVYKTRDKGDYIEKVRLKKPLGRGNKLTVHYTSSNENRRVYKFV